MEIIKWIIGFVVVYFISRAFVKQTVRDMKEDGEICTPIVDEDLEFQVEELEERVESLEKKLNKK